MLKTVPLALVLAGYAPAQEAPPAGPTQSAINQAIDKSRAFLHALGSEDDG